MRKAPSAYSASQLEQLVAAIRNAVPTAVIEPAELATQILDLLYAVGTTNDGSEYAVAFAEAAATDLSDAQLAKQFRAISRAPNPLDPKICFGVAHAELNAAMRNEWSSHQHRRLADRPTSLLDARTKHLSEPEREEVKKQATRLALYHRSKVRRQRPRKMDQDTLLNGLAEIYLRFAHLDGHPLDLSHSVESYFISFCHLALRPFFPLTEVSPKALANRWMRIKKPRNLNNPARKKAP